MRADTAKRLFVRALTLSTVVAQHVFASAFVKDPPPFQATKLHQKHRRRIQRGGPQYAVSKNQGLSSLPIGISPFEKSMSKRIDVQADFRARAKVAVEAAMKDRKKLIEIEFPPLIGGDQSKSQFDDFDNIQELDKNKDWAVQFVPMFSSKPGYKEGKFWLIFPDLKECELARQEWRGGRYQAATYTTIEAVTNYLQGDGSYDAPWGASFAAGANKFLGGEKGDAGLLGNTEALDSLGGSNSPPTMSFVVQPGNGGPVEDWCNCETIHNSDTDNTMVVINGALDKLRGGYYPALFFPKLAKSVDRFFTRFESAFYLKPISDKGVYGWLFRVYPEPWQVVLQSVVPSKVNKDATTIQEDVVYVSEDRPSYNEAVAKLVAASKGGQIM